MVAAATTGFTTVLLAAAVLLMLAVLVATLLGAAQARLPKDDNQLIDAIDALLPQTQCAQCGYPGCKPYAEAVASGAALDLCPPGGQATLSALEDLLGERASTQLAEPVELLAVIDESRCIGCALCIPPCPVDAILGTNKYMHTVLAQHCTGCELCVAPCPVDCIDMLEVATGTVRKTPQTMIDANTPITGKSV